MAQYNNANLVFKHDGDVAYVRGLSANDIQKLTNDHTKLGTVEGQVNTIINTTVPALEGSIDSITERVEQLKGYVTNCILEAPNGVVTVNQGSNFTIKQGLKVLIPDGRNADGTLKNYVRTLEHDENTSIPPSGTDYTLLLYHNQGGSRRTLPDCKFIKDLPTIVPSSGNYAIYCEEANLVYGTSGSTTANWEPLHCAYIGFYKLESNKQVSNLYTPEPLHLLDRNQSALIAGWAMPSDVYDDLTLGASASNYTAPSNGWAMFSKKTDGSDQSISLGMNNNVRFSARAYVAGATLSVSLPVRKGRSFYVSYSATGETVFFRFIYAVGSEHEKA